MDPLRVGRGNVARRLGGELVAELVHCGPDKREGRWHLQFDFDHRAFQRLLSQRLGCTVLLTNRLDWTAEQVVAGYSGQQQVERVFRVIKDGDWLGCGRMHHWTDSKIRVHCSYCMLGLALPQYLHKEAQTVWPGLIVEQLLKELRVIQ